MNNQVVLVLLCICSILLGAVSTPPIKWVVLVLSVIGLLITLMGAITLGIGHG